MCPPMSACSGIVKSDTEGKRMQIRTHTHTSEGGGGASVAIVSRNTILYYQ